MKNGFRFILTFIRRDLRSFSGGRSLGDFVFQSLLPIIGTVLVLSTLCAAGIIVLSFFNGYRVYLQMLESDPSSSAIRLEGYFKKGEPRLSLMNLVWDRNLKRFHTSDGDKDPHEIPIVRFMSPYRQRGLFCVDKNGYLAGADVFWGTTVRASDENTRRSIINSFVTPGRYFKSDDDQGLIISLSLYRNLGYDEKQPLPTYIRVIAPNIVELPYNKIRGLLDAKPFTQADLAQYTVSIPLIGVARTLPDGSFIMTEGLFWNLQEQKGVYDKSRPVSNFSIEFEGSEEPVRMAVNRWLEKAFKRHALKYPPRFIKNMGKKSITVAFSPKGKTVKGENNETRVFPTAGEIERRFLDFFETLSMNVVLNLGEPREYRGQIETYNGTMLFLKNIPEVFNNIDKLYFFFKSANIYANTHQMETIKKYRQDMNLISVLLPFILGSCVFLIVIYVLVSFTLFVQNKRHKIGVMLALGATSNMVRFIYVVETSIVFCGSYGLGLLINYGVSKFFIRGEWPFAFETMSNLAFFSSAFLMANLAGLLAVHHTLGKMPLDLLGFRE